MNLETQTAVHALVDQAINKVCQQIDHSLPYVGSFGPKAAKGAPPAPNSHDNPALAGALANELTEILNPFVEAIRCEMRQVAALRLLDRAERLDRQEPLPTPPAPSQSPQHPPQPSSNGKVAPAPLKGGFG